MVLYLKQSVPQSNLFQQYFILVCQGLLPSCTSFGQGLAISLNPGSLCVCKSSASAQCKAMKCVAIQCIAVQSHTVSLVFADTYYLCALRSARAVSILKRTCDTTLQVSTAAVLIRSARLPSVVAHGQAGTMPGSGRLGHKCAHRAVRMLWRSC